MKVIENKAEVCIYTYEFMITINGRGKMKSNSTENTKSIRKKTNYSRGSDRNLSKLPFEESFVYVLLCGDNSLYCGWTNDLDHRIEAHRIGKGAKYTRGRGPLVLIFKKSFGTKGEGLSWEYKFKKLGRRDKLRMILSEENDFKLDDNIRKIFEEEISER